MNLLRKNIFSFIVGKRSKNLYEVLQVPRSASSEEIKASYYKLAKEYHPDTHQQKTNVAEIFKEINQAYNTLKDPTKRKQYDQQNFTAQGQKKQYKFYNTQHNYGYNQRTYRKNPYQANNPFDSTFNQKNPFRQNGSTNPYNFNSQFSSTNSTRSQQQSPNPNENWEQYVKNQHRKNVAQNKRMVMDRIKRSNTIMIIIVGMISVYIIGQLTFKIYEFNSLYRVRSYPERLDPAQLKQYQQQSRGVVRKDYY